MSRWARKRAGSFEEQEMIFPFSMKSSFSPEPLAMTSRPVHSGEACLTSSSTGVALPSDFDEAFDLAVDPHRRDARVHP